MYLAVTLVVVLSNLASRATVCVKPKLTVPSAFHVDHQSHITPGTVEVYCSSNTNQLKINFEDLPSEVLNSTTIKTVVIAKESDLSLICCCAESNKCSNYENLEVNYHPNVTGFACSSNNFEILTCSWSANSFRNRYRLFTSYSRNNVQICKGRINYGYTDYSCVWNLKNIDFFSTAHMHLRLPINLEICNAFVCVNHTKDVNLATVSKLNAPKILDIKADGAYRASLKWRFPFSELILPSNIEILYEIQYSLGIEYHKLASGTMKFNQFTTVTDFLQFPCPDKKYTIRIACRPVKAPLRYMSDFAYTTIRTQPDPTATGLDPICVVKPRPVETPPVLVYKIQVFRQKVEEDIEKYEILRRRLAEKLAVIENLQRSKD